MTSANTVSGLLLRLRARRLVARPPREEDVRGAVERGRGELEAVAAIVAGDLLLGRLRDAISDSMRFAIRWSSSAPAISRSLTRCSSSSRITSAVAACSRRFVARGCGMVLHLARDRIVGNRHSVDADHGSCCLLAPCRAAPAPDGIGAGRHRAADPRPPFLRQREPWSAPSDSCGRDSRPARSTREPGE